MTAVKRLLIFDLDGTLADTMGPLGDLFCEMLMQRCGVPDEVSRPIYTALAGKGPRAQFAEVLRQAVSPDEALVDDLTSRYWRLAEKFPTKLFPETLDVLSALRRDGHTLVVSSGSTPESVERKLRLTGIDRLFRLALGSSPDLPDMAKGSGHFGLISRSLHLRAGELQTRGVFIGDGVYDMQVASEAGILAVGRVADGNGCSLQQAGARHLIEDLRDIESLLACL